MHVRNVLAAACVAAVAVGAGSVAGPAGAAVAAPAPAEDATSTIYAFHNPDGVGVSPNGTTAYVADSGAVASVSGRAEYGLFLVSTATHQITKTIVSPSFNAPVAVAVSHSGEYAYVLNSTGTVSVVSTASDTVTATIGTASTSDPAPGSIVISPNGTTGYVSEDAADAVLVLNLTTDSVTGSIPLGNPSALAISPDGTKLYATTSDGVSVIATASDTVSGTMSIIGSLGGMVVSPDGGTLYVAENDAPYENILLIGTTTLSFTGTIYGQEAALGAYAGSGALVLSPDGTSLYITAADGTSTRVTAVNTATDAVTATATVPETSVSSLAITTGSVIYAAGPGTSSQGTVAVIGTSPLQLSGLVASVGSHPVALALSPDGKTAYVANYDSGNLTAISTATQLATGVVAVGSEPDAVAVSPDGKAVYVVNDNEGDGTVSVISAGTLAVTATIPVGINPTSIAIAPDGKTIYVANSGSVSVINAAANMVTATIPGLGTSPDLVVSPDGSKIYVAQDGAVAVISTVTDTVTGTLHDSAWALAVSPDGKALYAAWGADSLSVINAATGAVVKTLNPVYDYGLTGSLALGPDGQTLYVAGSPEAGTGVPGSGEVTAIDTASDAVTSTLPVPTSSPQLSAIAVSPTGAALYVTDPGTSTVNTLPAPAAITSGTAATFTTGQRGAFTATATGTPTPSLRESGTLPGGLTFKDNGNGSATLSGTPAAGSGKVYHVTLTASNGVGTAVPQAFTLTVDQAAKITSKPAATLVVGKKATFTITTSGYPAAATITGSGTLPKGVTFTNKKNGTATIAGTPAAGTGRAYSITLKASNGVGATASQSFRLTVNQAPKITSAAKATFTYRKKGSFEVTTSGYPVVTLTESGALPKGVTFRENKNGTATISGTPAVNASKTYTLTIKASNGIGSAVTVKFQLVLKK
jgi:YVTN family beta-propeller protein